MLGDIYSTLVDISIPWDEARYIAALSEASDWDIVQALRDLDRIVNEIERGVASERDAAEYVRRRDYVREEWARKGWPGTVGPARKALLFDAGEVVITPAARAVIDERYTDPDRWIENILRYHAQGDWGEVSADHAARNETSLLEGGVIHSVYKVPGRMTGTPTRPWTWGQEPDNDVWVITEADRSSTTLLLPDAGEH